MQNDNLLWLLAGSSTVIIVISTIILLVLNITVPNNLSLFSQIWLSAIIAIIAWRSSKNSEKKIQNGIQQILGIMKETLQHSNTTELDLQQTLEKIEMETERIVENISNWNNESDGHKRNIISGQIMFNHSELNELATRLEVCASNPVFQDISNDLSRIIHLSKSELEFSESGYDIDPYQSLKQMVSSLITSYQNKANLGHL